MGGGSVDVSAWTSHDHTARSTADERVERAGRPGSGTVHRAEGGFLGGLGQSAGSAEHARSLRRRIPPPAGLVVVAEAGSDVGNDRPRVTYDGLMVRRRVVIAIHPTSGADLVFLRRKMDDAATRLHMTLSTISVSVLDPAVLENLTPESPDDVIPPRRPIVSCGGMGHGTRSRDTFEAWPDPMRRPSSRTPSIAP